MEWTKCWDPIGLSFPKSLLVGEASKSAECEKNRADFLETKGNGARLPSFNPWSSGLADPSGNQSFSTGSRSPFRTQNLNISPDRWQNCANPPAACGGAPLSSEGWLLNRRWSPEPTSAGSGAESSPMESDGCEPEIQFSGLLDSLADIVGDGARHEMVATALDEGQHSSLRNLRPNAATELSSVPTQVGNNQTEPSRVMEAPVEKLRVSVEEFRRLLYLEICKSRLSCDSFVEVKSVEATQVALRKYQVDMDELANFYPSVGSLLHDEGYCVPCAFASKTNKSCHNGVSCCFCHHFHREVLIRRRGKKKRNGGGTGGGAC
ncbi:hypothetical protein CSUI_009781 [Cystoisospora suis]|uniref:C3H1-type domain-containing protein n=1 Tax=Cystoisospora suis TaxID=483139 RepID=A0A2C6KJ66_9APIC|nr:hypothetical protein CSUI_009781 [Cystoisospora suis]